MGGCFALVLHRKDKKRIKIAFSICVSGVFFLKVSLVINTTFRPDCLRLCAICFFLAVCFTQLTNACPYLRYSAVHLQHTLIQDADVMVLDVDGPLGAVIGSTTWHKNITFP